MAAFQCRITDIASFRPLCSLSWRSVCVAADLLEMKLDEATVVTVYLLPEAIAKVQPMLHACLERGARVLCNSWGLDPTQYRPTDTLDVADKGMTKLMLYTKESIVKAVADDASPTPHDTVDLSTQAEA